MNKNDMRNVMNSLAEVGIADDVVLKVIKSLADNQRYKVSTAYDEFCINCGIYYTGSMFAMWRVHKSGLDMSEWSDGIMETIYGWSDNNEV